MSLLYVISESKYKQYFSLRKFGYVFLLQLRYVDNASTLAELIIRQHDYLELADPNFITSLLKSKTEKMVLLLIDGYDEYTPGTNKDIDNLVKNGIGTCFVILTSRPGFLDKQIRDMFDGEIIIKGLSKENIRKGAERYLQSEEKGDKLLEQAQHIGVHELLKVPITLLMTCVVFSQKKELPKSKTELVKTIFQLSMDRSTLKLLNKKSQDMDNIDTLLNTLGDFSWQSLQNDVKQLLLDKVNCLFSYILVLLLLSQEITFFRRLA